MAEIKTQYNKQIVGVTLHLDYEEAASLISVLGYVNPVSRRGQQLIKLSDQLQKALELDDFDYDSLLDGIYIEDNEIYLGND